MGTTTRRQQMAEDLRTSAGTVAEKVSERAGELAEHLGEVAGDWNADAILKSESPETHRGRKLLILAGLVSLASALAAWVFLRRST
jgi:hypothetical protein